MGVAMLREEIGDRSRDASRGDGSRDASRGDRSCDTSRGDGRSENRRIRESEISLVNSKFYSINIISIFPLVIGEGSRMGRGQCH